jgi:exopolysaccharide biosynthesis predicted pyruvyltransferase EpsI
MIIRRSNLTITSSVSSQSIPTSERIGGSHTKEAQAGAAIERLQAEITRALAPEFDGVRSVALVDFPDHPNVGDSAIYLGEVEWLRRQCGLVPRYVSSVYDFSAAELQRAVPEGPILIHGGGNFGDIWPHHQDLREKVLTAFVGRRIVQLPQTIHFEDVAARDRAARKIAAHGDVLLLVRDQDSFDLARDVFKCDVRLCPDMAMALGPRRRHDEAQHDLLLVLRTDKERADHSPLPTLPEDAVVCDWVHEPNNFREPLRRWSVRRAALEAPVRILDPHYRRGQFYRALAAHRVARGLRLLSSGRTVMSDRLHSHLLCLLLRIPHIVFDNNYGKLSSFIETWTAECGLVTRAENRADALDRWKIAFQSPNPPASNE